MWPIKKSKNYICNSHIIVTLNNTVLDHRFSNWVPNDPELFPSMAARDQEGGSQSSIRETLCIYQIRFLTMNFFEGKNRQPKCLIILLLEYSPSTLKM